MTTATLPITATTSTARRRWRRTQDIATSEPASIEFTWANRRPGTAGFARWTAFVGQRINDHGLVAATREVDNLVEVARQLAVATVAVDVLSDSTQPEPARCRAFAVVVSALTTSTHRPSDTPST
jgi:hypothetical protein